MKNVYSWIILLLLSLLSIVLNNLQVAKYGIYLLFLLKFVLVAWHFMELKKAHIVWKITLFLIGISAYGLLFI